MSQRAMASGKTGWRNCGWFWPRDKRFLLMAFLIQGSTDNYLQVGCHDFFPSPVEWLEHQERIVPHLA